MVNRKNTAARDFRRMMTAIVVIAIVTVIIALSVLAYTGELRVHLVIATILGVFFSMLLGAGLFALAFFSDKSGHDETVTRATERKDEPKP